MNKQTIQKLNQINEDFYTKIATSFDESRAKPWDGWYKSIPLISNTFSSSSPEVNIFDIGCGNGRFGEFLVNNLPDFKLTYKGIDSNKQLLGSAQQKLENTDLSFTLEQQDILSLIKQSSAKIQQFDVIAIYGVMHHIPSFNLRLELLNWCHTHLKQEGLLLLSFWQFTTSKQFKRHVQPSQFKEINIDKEELEPNDFFLDWQRGEKAIRYCHLITEEEEQHLISSEKWEYKEHFDEDNSNHYIFLKKK